MSSVKTPTAYTDVSGERNKIIPGMLYLVATPIGNLADLSERAIKVLSGVDFIAAEDTRNSMKLLSIIGVQKPMVSYFEHNRRERGEQIIARLAGGQSCALITDAGMPAISDPGEDLVRLCAGQGIPVTCVPGCCAAVTALALSALPSGRFCFEGFLSANKGERRDHLKSLELEKRTMIFHEAPHKLKNTLADMSEVFGTDRKISLCRELTKLNEEIMRTTIGQAVEYYDQNEPRGEYVLVVEGIQKVAEAQLFWADMSVEEHVEYYIGLGNDKKAAIKAVAKDREVPKNEIYMQFINNSQGENS